MSTATKREPIAIADSGSAEWFAARSRGIGASEIAAAAGLSSWQTPLELYARKRGELPPVEETDDMRLGKKFEPIIVSEFEHRTGLEICAYPCPMYQSPDHAWLFATPDADLVNGELLEAKKTGFRMAKHWGDEGTDQAPAEYVAQAQIQMAVMGRERVHIAALVDGSRLKVYPVERNDELIGLLIAAAKELWERIGAGDAPEPDYSHRSTPDLMRELYGTIDSDVIELPQNVIDAWGQYEMLGSVARDAESKRAAHKSIVLHHLGNHYAGRLGDGRIIRRKLIQKKEYTVAASEYIEVRAVKDK